MPTRLPVLLSVCATAIFMSTPSAAVTQQRDCPGPRIEADAALRERYPELLGRLRAELPTRTQVDACALVELRWEAPVIVVAVSLPDGRAAARDVARHEDILPTLQALLLVPESSEPLKAAPAAPSPRPRVPRATSDGRGAEERDRAPAPTQVGRSFGFELSLVSGARVGDGQYGYGAGVLSFVELKGWLLGFQGRADGYRSLQGSDPETALALGLLLGKRFDLHRTALDLTAGPAVAMRGASFSSSESVSAQAMPSSTAVRMPPPSEPDVGPLPRLLLAARLGFAPHSVFRTFIGIDGELGPTRSADASHDSGTSGRMPAYTVGLSLGATLGTR